MTRKRSRVSDIEDAKKQRMFSINQLAAIDNEMNFRLSNVINGNGIRILSQNLHFRPRSDAEVSQTIRNFIKLVEDYKVAFSRQIFNVDYALVAACSVQKYTRAASGIIMEFNNVFTRALDKICSFEPFSSSELVESYYESRDNHEARAKNFIDNVSKVNADIIALQENSSSSQRTIIITQLEKLGYKLTHAKSDDDPDRFKSPVRHLNDDSIEQWLKNIESTLTEQEEHAKILGKKLCDKKTPEKIKESSGFNIERDDITSLEKKVSEFLSNLSNLHDKITVKLKTLQYIDSGVFTFYKPKLNVLKHSSLVFDSSISAGIDAVLFTKGAHYTRFSFGDKIINLVNMHPSPYVALPLVAPSLLSIKQSHIKQLIEIRKFVDKNMDKSLNQYLFYCGDFNINMYKRESFSSNFDEYVRFKLEKNAEHDLITLTSSKKTGSDKCCSNEFYSCQSILNAIMPPLIQSNYKDLECPNGKSSCYESYKPGDWRYTWDGSNPMTVNVLWPLSYEYMDYILFDPFYNQPFYMDNRVIRIYDEHGVEYEELEEGLSKLKIEEAIEAGYKDIISMKNRFNQEKNDMTQQELALICADSCLKLEMYKKFKSLKEVSDHYGVCSDIVFDSVQIPKFVNQPRNLFYSSQDKLVGMYNGNSNTKIDVLQTKPWAAFFGSSSNMSQQRIPIDYNKVRDIELFIASEEQKKMFESKPKTTINYTLDEIISIKNILGDTPMFNYIESLNGKTLELGIIPQLL